MADGNAQVEVVASAATMVLLHRFSVCEFPLSSWTTLIHAEIGTFMHPSEGEMVCESTNPKIPYFNAPIYLENKVSRSSSLYECY